MNWFNNSEKKKRKLEDKIDDLIHYKAEWGWARTPSELRRIQERLQELQEKYKELTGQYR